jgi:hypothetical protein
MDAPFLGGHFAFGENLPGLPGFFIELVLRNELA